MHEDITRPGLKKVTPCMLFALDQSIGANDSLANTLACRYKHLSDGIAGVAG